jgi:hypothetical protein
VSGLAGTVVTASDPVTLSTEIVLALAAVASALTPIVLARRKARREALKAAQASAVNSSDLTLAGWTALNAALQQEITRLQGVQERMQARIDLLESEIAALQKLVIEKRPPGA